ncbi:outer membrane protein assembly factor BamB family protein [Catellatospora vulcania]|uniref:outer membrane protein assembly factor BamB family protein n=1 Tax=Catellatospora vulcania TaxID=1460450 RepID=UPI0012D4967E|nr:PQQ-binding-like beta-propeller repeat protein [Catellatospora vulcania]
MTWRTLPRGARLAVIGAVSVALLAAAGLVAWRVLGPAEVVTPARKPYPAPVIPAPGPIGVLVSAPLVLDDRIRVFATKRQVWADAPPNFKYERSALWSLRRWPAQLIGVVAVGGDTPTVVSSWSDGELVGTDARTGAIAWQVGAEVLGDTYTGRRTGASTVYQPPGLFTTDGAVIVAGPAHVTAYDPATGAQRWQAAAPVGADCRGTDLTSARQYLVHDTCTGTVRRFDTGTGTAPAAVGSGTTSVEPVSCAVGHSLCQGVRLTGSTVEGLVLTGPDVEPSPPLAAPGALLSGGIVVTAPDPAAGTRLDGRDPRTGDLRWTWHPTAGDPTPPPRLLAASGDRVLLLSPDHTLIAISAESGRELSRSSLQLHYEPDIAYDVAQVHTSGRYLALVRTIPGVPATAPDDDFYLTPRTVLLAAS